MNTSETPNPPTPPPRPPSKKLPIILIIGMVIYGTIFMVLSAGHYTTTQICFVVQLLNALGFFIALAALVRTFKD